MTETDHKKKLHEHQKDIAAKAFLVNSHISPRKMALILDEVRLKSVSHARRILYFSKKKSADMLLKLLNSAVANAINNNHYHKDDVENFLIAHIWVGKGMVLKRIEPRARGSSNRLLKRYSNVSLYLKEASFMPQKVNKNSKVSAKKTETSVNKKVAAKQKIEEVK